MIPLAEASPFCASSSEETLRLTLADASIVGLSDTTVAGAPSTEKVSLISAR